jgi:hypothetical protein
MSFMSKREEIDDVVWKMEKGLAVMAEATSDSEKLKSAVTELQIAASEKQEEYEVRFDKERFEIPPFQLSRLHPPCFPTFLCGHIRI